jgi:hypothetical protein
MFTTVLSSGPFLVAPTAKSVDWVIVNNSARPQTVRVTVYKCAPGQPKVALVPGAVTETLASGTTFHNSNSVPNVFVPGFYYEVVVECNSVDVLPAINQWSDHAAAEFIPATLIPAGSFAKLTAQRIELSATA